jgi:hypothetical protein
VPGQLPLQRCRSHSTAGHATGTENAETLVQLAVDYTDFRRITDRQYQGFVDAYGGYDVTRWPSYRVLADIQELRWVGFAINRSDAGQAVTAVARHRIACLRGLVPKPWTWTVL